MRSFDRPKPQSSHFGARHAAPSQKYRHDLSWFQEIGQTWVTPMIAKGQRIPVGIDVRHLLAGWLEMQGVGICIHTTQK